MISIMYLLSTESIYRYIEQDMRTVIVDTLNIAIRDNMFSCFMLHWPVFCLISQCSIKLSDISFSSKQKAPSASGLNIEIQWTLLTFS